MNTNTGAIYNPMIYTDRVAMERAIEHGDPVVEVSHRVAKLMNEAHDARRRKSRNRRAQQAASRKRNREL